MKHRIFFIFSIFVLCLFSCKSTDQEATVIENQITEPGEDEVIEVIVEPEVEIIEDEPEVPEPEVFEDDEVMDVDEVVEVDDEYLRSINEIDSDEESVTLAEFNDDKAAILSIIDELSDVMTNFEFDKWKTFISPTSIEYYSNPANLRKAQKKLPDKQIQLKGLRDYFKYVFIPSRKVSKVEEIRYISKSYIKAVEVREEEDTTVVYYYFVKENGSWKVKLPEVN
ncbi:MAG: hypothetical protein MJ185_12230 [Treponema sp.]|nr:hypothetical protein [Treponema sp.]